MYEQHVLQEHQAHSEIGALGCPSASASELQQLEHAEGKTKSVAFPEGLETSHTIPLKEVNPWVCWPRSLFESQGHGDGWRRGCGYVALGLVSYC